ncbi:hypothetical protein MVEN_01827100 [Mycena venus]|uniref:Zn(2)-C6 fungal-type domain-containing protein n=1 Tax=Mycena venus TaxID=2733690 RepID=A0A8H6XL01_9AGAR|nr:hypothetical protein MVEN_01827100 [Mycena venus]
MFSTEFSSDFDQDTSNNVDLGNSQGDFLMANADLLNRGRGLDVAINYPHTDTRSFSHSPQCTYRLNFEDGFGHGHENSEPKFSHNSPDVYGAYQDPYLTQESDSNHLDYSNIAFAADPAAAEHVDQGVFAHSHDINETAPFAFGPRLGNFSAQSSPGYIQHELPEIAHQRPVHVRNLSSDYLYVQRHRNVSPLPQYHPSLHVSPVHHPAENTWDTHRTSSALNNLYPMPIPLRPPSLTAVFNAFGHYPPPTGVTRRVPQMFKLSTGRKKHVDKKQPMACFFCRERKIGCQRPPEDEPDQTCNQCARRDRVCEYPTESRRGQHNRMRCLEKKSTKTDQDGPSGHGSYQPTDASGSPADGEGVDRETLQ